MNWILFLQLISFCSCIPTNLKPKQAISVETKHLVLLIHGISGLDADLKIIEDTINNKSRTDVYVLNVDCNHGKTYDGVVSGGTRIFHQLVDKTANTTHPLSLSIIAHSLGAIYAR